MKKIAGQISGDRPGCEVSSVYVVLRHNLQISPSLMTRQWWCNKIKLEKSCLEGFGSTCHSYIINVKMRMRIPWQTKVLSNQETWIRLECFEIFLHSRKCFSHHGVLLISAFLHPLSCYFIFVFHVCCLSTLVTFILLYHLLWLHQFFIHPLLRSSPSLLVDVMTFISDERNKCEGRVTSHFWQNGRFGIW